MADSGKKNPHAVALGRLGGLKGGPARAAALSPERRREIAFKAARARWDKPKIDDNLKDTDEGKSMQESLRKAVRALRRFQDG